MRIIPFCIFLMSCTGAADFYKTADDILTDDAITIKVDRDAIRDNIDVHIVVDVVNKPRPIKQSEGRG